MFNIEAGQKQRCRDIHLRLRALDPDHELSEGTHKLLRGCKCFSLESEAFIIQRGRAEARKEGMRE
jgi:hypothetical protein